MARRWLLALVIGLGLVGMVGVSLMSAQQRPTPVNDKPLTEKWAPTEWGPNDKAGAVNRTTPAMVLKAMSLVKQGKVATLGKLYHSSIPAFGARSWTLSIPGTPTGGPFGKNALFYHDEFVSTELGQIGTQFDGPGHIGVRTSKGDFMYNGRWREQAYERGGGDRVVGMGDLGVEHVAEKGFVCRGVLLDAPAYRGVKRLPIPKDAKSPGIVTAADVQAMVKKQGLAEIGEGDCVFLYTGHGDLWLNAEWKGLPEAEKAKRRAEFTSGEPGFGASACEYMAQRKIILTGGDTSANDAQPAGEQGEEVAVPCHTEMQTRRGIWNIENLEFTQLLRDKVYEFAFVWSPLKVVGGTGSPGNPIALY
jgi:kynurenine formamidase